MLNKSLFLNKTIKPRYINVRPTINLIKVDPKSPYTNKSGKTLNIRVV